VKILLSAFACEPFQGSEPEIGWGWALRLAELGHRVSVLTQRRSRAAIERALAALPVDAAKPRFIYFDVPRMLRWETRGPLHVHYWLWQYGAARFARHLNVRERFDCVHHVTFGGLRAPSLMGRLGIPFIFGPVSGGETAPWRLRYGYTLLGFVLEALRDLANVGVRFLPAFAKPFAGATKVYVTSDETVRLVPRRHRQKVAIELAIARNPAFAPTTPARPANSGDRPLRVLYAGRFCDFKGMHLGLPAFARLLEIRPQARLTMVGDGPTRSHWQRLAQRLRISARITWVPWHPHEDMAKIYNEHDVMLFPSLRDSGGFVVLEAMDCGLPVVCLRLGGPGITVNDSCGRAIDVADKRRADVVNALADALAEVAEPNVNRLLSRGATLRCREFSWEKKIQRIYGIAS
jgi:glycosyltransferase involved in cell wall biosynthesis